jgi:hypothetical protein
MTHDPMRQADIKRRLANRAKAPRIGARTLAGRASSGGPSVLDTREHRMGAAARVQIRAIRAHLQSRRRRSSHPLSRSYKKPQSGAMRSGAQRTRFA